MDFEDIDANIKQEEDLDGNGWEEEWSMVYQLEDNLVTDEEPSQDADTAYCLFMQQANAQAQIPPPRRETKQDHAHDTVKAQEIPMASNRVDWEGQEGRTIFMLAVGAAIFAVGLICTAAAAALFYLLAGVVKGRFTAVVQAAASGPGSPVTTAPGAGPAEGILTQIGTWCGQISSSFGMADWLANRGLSMGGLCGLFKKAMAQVPMVDEIFFRDEPVSNVVQFFMIISYSLLLGGWFYYCTHPEVPAPHQARPSDPRRLAASKAQAKGTGRERDSEDELRKRTALERDLDRCLKHYLAAREQMEQHLAQGNLDALNSMRESTLKIHPGPKRDFRLTCYLLK